MGGSVKLVFLLTPDDAIHHRAVSACIGRAEVVRVASVQALEAMLPRDTPAVIVTEVTAREGGVTGAGLLRLRSHYPWTTRLVLMPLAKAEIEAMLPLLRSGFDEVVLRGADELRSRLASALSCSDVTHAAAAVYEDLAPRLPRDVAPLLQVILRGIQQRVGVDALADALHQHRRTFQRHLERECGMPARALITWMRLLVAAHLFANSGWPADLISIKVGFSEASPLHRALGRSTGLHVTDLRSTAGVEQIRTAFLGRISPRAPCG